MAAVAASSGRTMASSAATARRTTRRDVGVQVVDADLEVRHQSKRDDDDSEERPMDGDDKREPVADDAGSEGVRIAEPDSPREED